MREVFDGIERKFRKECRRNAQGHRNDANRVSIRRRFCTLLRSDISARTGSIVRNELLTYVLLKISAVMRPKMSVGPAGGNGMIIRTGLIGYC